eukprot:scaffold97765_cov19-Tisochrysis_lutea.AAC.1
MAYAYLEGQHMYAVAERFSDKDSMAYACLEDWRWRRAVQRGIGYGLTPDEKEDVLDEKIARFKSRGKVYVEGMDAFSTPALCEAATLLAAACRLFHRLCKVRVRACATVSILCSLRPLTLCILSPLTFRHLIIIDAFKDIDALVGFISMGNLTLWNRVSLPLSCCTHWVPGTCLSNMLLAAQHLPGCR